MRIQLAHFGRVAAVILLLGVAVCAAQTVSVPAQVVSYADMVVYNGKIYTMDNREINLDPGHIVQAMALRGGKIVAVGTDQDMLLYAGPQSAKIDLHGRTVIPGIIDSHTHIHNNALAFYAKSHPEVLESVAKQFQVTGNTEAELRRGIEVVLKENMAHPTKDQWAFIGLPTGGSGSPGIGTKFIQTHGMTGDDLDKLTKAPVLLMSHPAYMTNSAGKEMLAKLYDADPETVTAVDEDPNETGGYGDFIVYARAIMVDQYFGPRIPLLADITHEYLERSAAMGITTFSSHIEGIRFFDAFQKLVRENKMPMRFAYSHYFGFEGNPDPSAFYLRMGDMAGLGTDTFWNIGLALGNIDEGPPMFCSTMEGQPDLKKREFCRNAPGSVFEKAIYTAIRSHQRIAVGHSWADKGIDYLIQTIERAMKDDPAITLDYIRSRKFSSDHCGLYPRPDQLPVLKKYGWLLSCNGSGINRSMPWLKTYGMKYAKWVSPMKSILDAGIPVVFENEGGWGEDPDHPESYFAPLDFLMTRKFKDGQMVAPEEAVDRVSLMKGMTTWASDFLLRSNEIGTLEPGKWADFVVLNKDYFTVPQPEIPYVVPVMTVMGGKATFLRADFGAETGQRPVGYQIKYTNLPKGDPYAAPATQRGSGEEAGR
jgi:predicted amidohydrolase YtcJ